MGHSNDPLMPPRGMALDAFAVVRARVALRLAAHARFPTNCGRAALKNNKTKTATNRTHTVRMHTNAFYVNQLM